MGKISIFFSIFQLYVLKNFSTPSTKARCLLNQPERIYLNDYQFKNILPGKLYDLDDQCMLINGANSNYYDCSVIKKFHLINKKLKNNSVNILVHKYACLYKSNMFK
jgi:hypothetical protein